MDLIENSPLHAAGVKPIRAESGYFLFCEVEGLRDKVPKKYYDPQFEPDMNLRRFDK